MEYDEVIAKRLEPVDKVPRWISSAIHLGFLELNYSEAVARPRYPDEHDREVPHIYPVRVYTNDDFFYSFDPRRTTIGTRMYTLEGGLRLRKSRMGRNARI